MSSVPLGIHNGTCIGVIDMGTQKSIYNSSQKVVLIWEVYVNNQVKTISREYTWSYHENAVLRLHLESWRGGPFTEDKLSQFELYTILGIPCKLEIRKNQKGLKQVFNIYRFPKNEEVPILKSKLIYFDMNNEKTFSAFNDIPKYIKERIKQSPEYTKLMAGMSDY